MTQHEHLPNAPIVEALLDVRIETPENVDQEMLASFQARLGNRYPTKQIKRSWSGAVELKADAPPVVATSGGPIGYQFLSPDGKQVVQARKDGFSFSRLRPYTNWTTFSKEAQDLWKRYADLVRPKKVQRIALRYVNRMELPLPLASFREYVLTGPEIAPELPQDLSSYFFRAVIPRQDAEAFAIITEATEQVEGPKAVLPLILDIDVFRRGAFTVAAEKLWPLFDKLRDLKNEFFFASITDKAKELFK